MDAFDLKTGVSQGYLLSPLFFHFGCRLDYELYDGNN